VHDGIGAFPARQVFCSYICAKGKDTFNPGEKFAQFINSVQSQALDLGRYAPINPVIKTARYSTPRIASRIEKARA
jgi:hypothetical protein